MQKRHEDPQFGIEVRTDEVQRFELYRWREAIKTWQEKIWSGCFNKGRCSSPGIPNAILTIDSRQTGPRLYSYVSIVYYPGSKLYQATGHSHGIRDLLLKAPASLLTQGTSDELEVALARFARDRSVKSVLIKMSDPRYVVWLALVNERGRLIIGTARQL